MLHGFQAMVYVTPVAKMSRAAFATKQLLNYLRLEFYTETSLVPHGKVLSFPIAFTNGLYYWHSNLGLVGGGADELQRLDKETLDEMAGKELS